MMDYNTIKETAKDFGTSIKDFLVLAPGNDPFYVGSPGQMEKAQWFAKIYKKMGSPGECHIRRVHYWLVSQRPKYKKPDGAVYGNTLKDWKFLVMASKYSRYAGLVDIDRIVDRRNPHPIINLLLWENENLNEEKDGIDKADIIETIANKFFGWNPHNTQAYHVELWCEKSTMNDILEPIAKRFGANLVTGLGELSITAVHKLINRIENVGKPVRIFYLSDFDPAGECMPISIGRKIEFFIQERGLEPSVKLKQLLLTPEQCKAYDLPTTPIKDTDLRKSGFEDRHGIGATELDALEANHPGELKKIITNALKPYFNIIAWNSALELREKLRKHVSEFLEDKIENVLEDLDLSEFQDMEPKQSEEIHDEDDKWLLNSDLDYGEQLESFKKFRKRSS